MNRDLVIGLDASTSAAKAIAWDVRGVAVAEGRAAIPMANPASGRFEQDPEDWWSSAGAAMRELTARIDARRVAGIAISNQRETFGAFLRDGVSLRPGMVWLDDRGRPQMKRFGETFGAQRLHEISGRPLDPEPCLHRILWMKENEPDLFARAEVFAEVHAYLIFRLTGRWTTSTASADPMGLLDMRSFDWSDEILAAAGLPRAKLPELARPGGFLGETTPAAALATGLLPGLPVFAGGGDGQCAGTGVAALRAGRAYVNLGTAAVAGAFGATYVFDRAFRTETAVSDHGYVYEISLRSGTFLIDWLVGEAFGLERSLRGSALAKLEAEAALCPIGAGGLVLAPYWQGCKSPHWDGDARGIIAGLTGSTRRAHLFRAALEGVALEIAGAMAGAAAATGATIEHCVAIGGGASSDLWVQILADANALPIHRSRTTEASALGAAMAAAKGAGWFGAIEEAADAMASPTIRTFEPDARRVEVYRELRQIQAELWPLVSAWNQRLVEFAERAR
jgi:sugar (pentulose or hexulose) kinase